MIRQILLLLAGRRCAGIYCPVLVLLAISPLFAADRVDPSTLNNKVVLGYQGWFTCPEDGSGRWTHWSRGAPAPETLTIDMYPDLSEFDRDELCEAPGMTIGGKPAYLFSSRNLKTVKRHFQWMRQYGLDGVLVQRFVGTIKAKRADGEVVLRNIMEAARETGRTFAIEYDITGGDPSTFAQILKEDWMYLVDEIKVTSHPNYQHHAGRPVVSVWGMGLNEPNHPPADPQMAKELIDWFKFKAEPRHRVTYMGGVPSRWRVLTNDARPEPAWAEVYAMMDIVQPWTVGRYATLEAADRWNEDFIKPDLKKTAENKQEYMPVVFPGFSWHNLRRGAARQNQIPRLGGEFLWRQAYNAKVSGAKMLKIAMFDEVDESTAILKVVSRRSQAPDQGYWLTLDADGLELPSDWYLRLAGEITKMFHGASAPSPVMPKPPAPAANSGKRSGK